MINHGWIGDYSFSRQRINPNSHAVYDVDRKKRLTYEELECRAKKLANYLLNSVGVKKGDRIAFIARNGIELIDAYFATAKTGTILVPYNFRLSSEELGRLIAMERPRALFYEDIFADLILDLKSRVEVERYIPISEQSPDSSYFHYEKIIQHTEATPVSCPGLDLEDIHLIIHTGGTTGLPKGAMLSHRCLLFNALNEICTWGISHQDKAHILLPLFHTGGWNLLTLPLLHAGGQVVLNRQFDPTLALRLIEQEKTTFVFGAATIFRMMVEQETFRDTDFSSVKWIMAGAAPTPKNIMEQFWNKGIPFVLGYGMTEAGPNNLTMPAQFLTLDKIKEKYASVGKPMYLTQVRIVDDQGKDLGVGQPGELIWSGPQIFSGYWDNPEETAATLKDGWVHSGDIAYRDEEGFYYIVGRKKNMYISGGENVFPPEVENVIYQLPQVHEVCVFGVPDPKWGETGKAVIALKPGQTLSKQEVQDFLKDHLAKYKIPTYITFVDSLPKNSAGKIMTAKIAEIYGNVQED